MLFLIGKCELLKFFLNGYNFEENELLIVFRNIVMKNNMMMSLRSMVMINVL